MEKTDNRLVDWVAIEQTKCNYAEEIAILLEHNTYMLESDRSLRFVNTIISDAQPRVDLARTFIIDGIGYDFNQVSWESFERDAEAKSYFLTVLAESKILYARSEADEQRFLYLRAKLMSNLADFPYMFKRGLEWIDNAMEVYKSMMFETELGKVRKAAGFISDFLAVALACLNQTYFKGIDQITEMRKFEKLPEHFIDDCENMAFIDSKDELKEKCRRMIEAVLAFFTERDPKKEEKVVPDYRYLAEWYQECCYYFRRVYAYCKENQSWLAFHQCVGLQPDLDDLARDYQIQGLDILTSFDAENLEAFAERVHQVEQRIVDTIQEHKVTIDAYDSVEDFIRKNS